MTRTEFVAVLAGSDRAIDQEMCGREAPIVTIEAVSVPLGWPVGRSGKNRVHMMSLESTKTSLL